MDFDGYEFNELIFNLEYDIYSALKPKEYEYCVYIKDVSSDFFSFDTIKKFPSKKEALSFLHKSAKIKEKDSNGKVHYYREYNVTRNGVTTKEREEYSLVKTVKGYHPEYSKKTLTMMRRCLKKMKEARIYAKNISRLIDSDCDEETFRKSVKKELDELKNSPLIDEESIERAIETE